jgi:redox-sensitive bicupin YhaK (pirin superfamily)
MDTTRLTEDSRRVNRIVDTKVERGMHANHRVRLVLEPGRWAEHDPFLMLAEDWFDRGTFGDHPHRGFETVTLVLEGAIEHRDNHGGHGVLGPGDVQWMTAGRGVVHNEEAGPGGAHSLQLWLNLPAALKMTEPRYQDLRGAEMPVRSEPGAELRLFSGSSGGVVAPTHTHVPITMIEMRLDAAATVALDVPLEERAFIYIITGSGRFGADRAAAAQGQVVWFEPSRSGAPSIAVQADEPMHAVLWAGKPLREPVAARGPFVMNTPQEILEAFQDFQAGLF